MIPPILYILCFQHLRKSPFPFLSYQPVLPHLIWSSDYHADCKWMLMATARIRASMNLKLVETGETRKVMRSQSKIILAQLTAGWLLLAAGWLLGGSVFETKKEETVGITVFSTGGLKVPNYELRIICSGIKKFQRGLVGVTYYFDGMMRCEHEQISYSLILSSS